MWDDSLRESIELRRAARELRERAHWLFARTARLRAVSQACHERAIALIRKRDRAQDLAPPATPSRPHPGAQTARPDRT